MIRVFYFTMRNKIKKTLGVVFGFVLLTGMVNASAHPLLIIFVTFCYIVYLTQLYDGHQ